MYRDIQPELRQLIEPVVCAHGLELVDATLKQGQGKRQLQIIVDTPVGDGRVNVGDCARVSREVGHTLDAQGTIPGSYLLEVCSPGVDRVLGREIDFERVVGRQVKIETREKLDGRSRFRGELAAFSGANATVRGEDWERSIPFASIARAKAFFPFESPGAKR